MILDRKMSKLTLEELACALVRPHDAAYASAGSVGFPFIQLRSARRRCAEYGGRMETVSWDRRAARSPEIPATDGRKGGIGREEKGSDGQ